MNRFTKLSPAGLALPDDAPHAEVGGIRINATGIIVAPQLANAGKYLAWKPAIAGVADFRFGGLTDWRAPEVEEIFPIFDRSRFDPALDPQLFQFLIDAYEGGKKWRLWTRTPWAAGPESYAWSVDLAYGSAYGLHQSGKGLVLPVRGPVPSPGQ